LHTQQVQKSNVNSPVGEAMHIADDTGFLPPAVESKTGFLPPGANSPVEGTVYIADDTESLPPDVESTTHHADNTDFLPPDADTVTFVDENGGTEYYHPEVDSVIHDGGFLLPPTSESMTKGTLYSIKPT
jgi:hypothetical protein